MIYEIFGQTCQVLYINAVNEAPSSTLAEPKPQNKPHSSDRDVCDTTHVRH